MINSLLLIRTGDADGGNTDGGEGGEGGQGRPRRNRRRFNRGPRKERNSEGNAEGGGQTDGGEGNENGGQKGGRPPRQRRFNRKPRTSGSNQVCTHNINSYQIIFNCQCRGELTLLSFHTLQDGGQEVQNTVTESTA